MEDGKNDKNPDRNEKEMNQHNKRNANHTCQSLGEEQHGKLGAIHISGGTSF